MTEPRTLLPPRPDASMSLLTDLFRNPVDEGYAEAAARRASTPQEQPPSRRRWLPLVALLLVGLLLAAAGLQVRRSADEVTAERRGLTERIDAAAARNVELETTAAALEDEISALQDAQLALDASGEAQTAELERLRTLAGTSRVVGPGVEVVVEDGPEDPVPDSGYDESKVSDLDLQKVVNGLWQAGAEAVSVNGQRVTSLSAIRSARDVILVNYRPLEPPYTVRAIGDPRTLGARFGESSGGDWLQAIAQYGIRTDVRNRDELELPAATLTLRSVDEEGTQ